MADKTHATAWTNASKELPEGITKIVDEIKKYLPKRRLFSIYNLHALSLNYYSVYSIIVPQLL